ncbi:MAG TPA: cysteine--tRNA ligase [Planctomycetota bacterium]|nr:cysteine--tRNA ligase [Planctomycetota bacterium]
MSLKLFNSLSRSLEEFKPLQPGKVSMYVCGPTVYDSLHLGHARFMIAFDAIRRYLQYRGFTVRYVMNFTDVDDKIINRANAEHRPWQDITGTYIREYHEVAQALNVAPADVFPKASEHFPEIIAMTEELIRRGHAYVVDGDVWFNVPSYPPYGKLSQRKLEDQQTGAGGRDLVQADKKRDPHDFALWKKAKPSEPHWPSPWGEGRPGWHIECSCMTLKHLGPKFDLHGGGMDLKFPHHENELAQSGAAGHAFASYWLHNGLVNSAKVKADGSLEAEKMSKSLGNFKTAKGLLKPFGGVYDPMAVRLFLLSTHYRSDILLQVNSIDEATAKLTRLRTALENGRRVLQNGSVPASDKLGSLAAAAQTARSQFEAAMDDDFNTALAQAPLFDLVTKLNAAVASLPGVSGADAQAVKTGLQTLETLLETLGIATEWNGPFGRKADAAPKSATATTNAGAATAAADLDAAIATELRQLEIDSVGAAGHIDQLLSLRNQARKAKKFTLADKVRDGLRRLGYEIEDLPGNLSVARRKNS